MGKSDLPGGLGASARPPAPRAWLKVLKVGPAAPVLVRFVSTRPVCLETHWAGSGEDACTLASGRCGHCEAGQLPRWTAFLAAQVRDAGPVLAVRVSAGAAWHCGTDHFTDGGPSLRGWWGELRRLAPKTNGPLKLSLRPPNCDLALLPTEPDLVDFVVRLFRVTFGPQRHLPPADCSAG